MAYKWELLTTEPSTGRAHPPSGEKFRSLPWIPPLKTSYDANPYDLTCPDNSKACLGWLSIVSGSQGESVKTSFPRPKNPLLPSAVVVLERVKKVPKDRVFGALGYYKFIRSISPTPPKFNSLPLKKGGWKTILSYWEGNFSAMLNFQGVSILNSKNGGLVYTPGSTNIAGWKMDPLMESMYFLLKMGIFQPAVLVYQRVQFLDSHFTSRSFRLLSPTFDLPILEV